MFNGWLVFERPCGLTAPRSSFMYELHTLFGSAQGVVAHQFLDAAVRADRR